jgi:hypothetical protein
MLIESRTIVGAAAAFALVGGALWGATMLFEPPQEQATVEITQIEDRSWTVEVTDLGAADSKAAVTAKR